MTFENGTVIEMINMDKSGELWCTAHNDNNGEVLPFIIFVYQTV
jgi:hypothetical protein